jgi:hypothetical protein
VTKEQFDKFPKWAKFVIRKLNTWRFQIMTRSLFNDIESVLRHGSAEQILQVGESLAKHSDNDITKPFKYIGEQMIIEADDLVQRRTETGNFKLMGNPEKRQELVKWMSQGHADQTN